MVEGAEFERRFRRAKRGDAEARRELLEDEITRLRAYVRLKTGPAIRARESCSDLVQSACREALEGIDRIECENAPAFRQWLFQVALNKIRHRAEYWGADRRDRAHEERMGAADAEALWATYGGGDSPSRHASAREGVERIEAAMDRLSEEHREIIVQARILGRPHRDIARETGRSEEAVRQLLARARARLGMLMLE